MNILVDRKDGPLREASTLFAVRSMDRRTPHRPEVARASGATVNVTVFLAFTVAFSAQIASVALASDGIFATARWSAGGPLAVSS